MRHDPTQKGASPFGVCLLEHEEIGMNKDTIRNFIRWLDEASQEEILAHQEYILGAMAKIQTREGRADAKLALRLIDEELLARMNLSSSRL